MTFRTKFLVLAAAGSLFMAPAWAQDVGTDVPIETDPVVDDMPDMNDDPVESPADDPADPTDPTDPTQAPDPVADAEDPLGDDPIVDDPVVDDVADISLSRPGVADLLGIDAPGVTKPHPGQGIGLSQLPDIGVPPGLAKKGITLEGIGALPGPSIDGPGGMAVGPSFGGIDTLGAGGLSGDLGSGLGGDHGQGHGYGRTR